MESEYEFSEDLKQRILNIIRRSWNGEMHLLEEGDSIILFHWVRNMNDQIYSFVPKKYRTPKNQNKVKNK